MTALSTLIAARDWLAVGPDRWCQGALALDENGLSLTFQPSSERCASASALGALCHCAGPYPGDVRVAFAIDGACGTLKSVVGRTSLDVWNDSLPPGRAGWERVIEAFNRAIEAEEARAHG